jgi:hypothetical protein
MVHKIALLVGGTAVAAVLAVALAAAGFSPNTPDARASDPTADPTAGGTPSPTTVTDTVYVAPVPAPKVIHVTKPAAANPKRKALPPIVIHKTKPSGEHEGGDKGGD